MSDRSSRTARRSGVTINYAGLALAAVSLVLVTAMTLSVRFSLFTLTHRGHYSFGLMALILLNYLVHVLPASIIAWRERLV